MTLDFNEIKNAGLKIDNPLPAAIISQEDSLRLATALATETRLPAPAATAAICIICQKGGTSKRAQGNIYAIVDGTRVELNTIRRIMNSAGIKYTLRQWARTNANLIYNVSELFNIEGDLSKKLSRLRPSITNSEKIWLSNFQMDNPECPEDIRKLLMEHYESLFPQKQMD